MGYDGNVTPVCVGAAGGSSVVMATNQTSAPKGTRTTLQNSDGVHSGVNLPLLFNERLRSVCVCMCPYV